VRRAAAAAALVAAVVATACGEKDESVPDVAPAGIRALAAAGLTAIGAVPSGSSFDSMLDGTTLRVRSSSPPRGGLAAAMASFESVRAQVVSFCPKPALLSCRPALQASGVLRAGQRAAPVAAALRRLAAQSYEQRPLVRGGRRRTLIVTANGELLAALRTRGRAVSLSFGGPRPPRTGARTPAGRLVVEAGPGAVAAIRPEVGHDARSALAGVRRVRFEVPLSPEGR
jgi:hypothetical protein